MTMATARNRDARRAALFMRRVDGVLHTPSRTQLISTRQRL